MCFPLDATYKVIEGKAAIQMFCKTQQGNHVTVLDRNFEPYFYVVPKDSINISEKLDKIKV